MARTGSEREVFEPWHDAAAKPHLALKQISKRFGDFVAVDDISLDIYQREFFSLLGPSGCGKSTLLRMLAGFERPSAGQILLEGDDMAGVPPHQRPVNMMFQSYALFPHMSVRDNIAFGLKQDGAPRAQIRQRVDEAIEMVQLGQFASRKPHQLSGGQRQRVALARCVVKRPQLVLLDEPLGALDKKLRQQTQFELMDIQEQLGLTFIIVTHDQEEAMTVSSRIAVMDEGRIVQIATPAELYEYPGSRYVAEFIGEVNIFEGRISGGGDGHTELTCSRNDCRFRADQSSGLKNGDQAWIALRPEKLRIDREPPADTAANCLQGQVLDIGYLGNLSIYHVELPSGQVVTATQTNRSRLVERSISWEDKVWLSWAPAACVVLDR